MLLKPTSSVFLAGQSKLDYRPYYKSCPAPPPPPAPKRWVTKTVCGTAKTYAIDYFNTSQSGGIGHGQQVIYELPGLPTTATTSGVPYEHGAFIYPARLLHTAAFCKTVTVYE